MNADSGGATIWTLALPASLCGKEVGKAFTTEGTEGTGQQLITNGAV